MCACHSQSKQVTGLPHSSSEHHLAFAGQDKIVRDCDRQPPNCRKTVKLEVMPEYTIINRLLFYLLIKSATGVSIAYCKVLKGKTKIHKESNLKYEGAQHALTSRQRNEIENHR